MVPAVAVYVLCLAGGLAMATRRAPLWLWSLALLAITLASQCGLFDGRLQRPTLSLGSLAGAGDEELDPVRTSRQNFYGRLLVGGKRPLRDFHRFARRKRLAEVIVGLFLHSTQQSLGSIVRSRYDDFRSACPGANTRQHFES